VRVSRVDKNAVFVSVYDEGVGLPAGFDPTTTKRLGSRLVSGLASQLGAEMTQPTSLIGANFALMVPLTVSAK
jgi:two-component sensor histidine kinase